MPKYGGRSVGGDGEGAWNLWNEIFDTRAGRGGEDWGDGGRGGGGNIGCPYVGEKIKS